ncbi:hypothetical protein [Glycomyces buryatensis]|uniref:hypothetical protein n=1 Tax=Glycomyces buryatensis TaxID=2570927 RepID=UPI001B3C1682|nr:hypothetical protein [Glycomyces buryatensis]
MGERGLGTEPVGVVAGAGQQLSGGLGAEPGQLQKIRSGPGDQGPDLGVGLLDLDVQGLIAASQAAQRDAVRRLGIGRIAGGAGSGQDGDELAAGPAAQSLAQVGNGLAEESASVHIDRPDCRAAYQPRYFAISRVRPHVIAYLWIKRNAPGLDPVIETGDVFPIQRLAGLIEAYGNLYLQVRAVHDLVAVSIPVEPAS